jgi:hypothetical protein
MGELRGRATVALASSGLREADAARIRRDVDRCAEAEARFKQMASEGGAAAAAQVLSASRRRGYARSCRVLLGADPGCWFMCRA